MISDTLGESDDTNASVINKVIQNPPKGAWRHEDFGTVVVGASTRSLLALFLVPFMVVWSGGALYGIYGTQIVKGEFDLFFSIVGIPFIIGAIFGWAFALMTATGKVEVVISGTDSYVFTGLRRIGIKKKFNWNTVIRIYENEPKIFLGGFLEVENDRAIFIEGETRIKLGSILNEKRRYYMVTVLQHLLSKKRRQANGDF